MAHKTFLPRPVLMAIAWLKNIASKLANYQTKYNITDGQVADTVAGAAYAQAWSDYAIALEAYWHKIVKYNQEQLFGLKEGETASVLPVPPAIPLLAAPDAGILSRASSIGQSIKDYNGYTEADGEDLGLIGADDTVDQNTVQPELKYRLVHGGLPEILWHKNQMDAMDLYKDSGNGIFTFFATVVHPNTIDNTPLSTIVGSAVWNYKAIYRKNDQQVGLWSLVLSVTVTGTGGITGLPVTIKP